MCLSVNTFVIMQGQFIHDLIAKFLASVHKTWEKNNLAKLPFKVMQCTHSPDVHKDIELCSLQISFHLLYKLMLPWTHLFLFASGLRLSHFNTSKIWFGFIVNISLC